MFTDERQIQSIPKLLIFVNIKGCTFPLCIRRVNIDGQALNLGGFAELGEQMALHYISLCLAMSGLYRLL